MVLTKKDFLNERAELNKCEALEKMINEHLQSKRVLKMREGERYYCCRHDILSKSFDVDIISETVLDENGNEKEEKVNFRNPNRSNLKVFNPFHKILVDQKVSYISAREPSITVKNSGNKKNFGAFRDYVVKMADESFNSAIQELVTGASNKGIEVLHVFYDKYGKLKYTVLPAWEVIPIYDESCPTELLAAVRFYTVSTFRNGKSCLVKKVEWWGKEDVTYYIEGEDGSFALDSSYEFNPAPHFFEVCQRGGRTYKKPHGFLKVPFIFLKNNGKEMSDLEPVKGLIDAYDMISSEGTNNLLDLVDLYWVIEGYGGETASAIAKKLRINKAVHVNDSSGKVEAKQVELPMEGRIKWLDMLRRDIFHFGQGIDIDSERFGNAPSGVSLKFRYTLLDLKANAMLSRLKASIKELYYFFTFDFNRKNNTDFDYEDIEVFINKSFITNEAETVDIINGSKGFVSSKTLLGRHPFVDDANEEMKLLEEEKSGSFEEKDN